MIYFTTIISYPDSYLTTLQGKPTSVCKYIPNWVINLPKSLIGGVHFSRYSIDGHTAFPTIAELIVGNPQVGYKLGGYSDLKFNGFVFPSLVQVPVLIELTGFDIPVKSFSLPELHPAKKIKKIRERVLIIAPFDVRTYYHHLLKAFPTNFVPPICRH